MRGPGRTVLALRLAIGLRILPETEFQELVQLLRGTGTARVTPAAQWLRHAECPRRMAEVARQVPAEPEDAPAQPAPPRP
ncbi:hypothetical protein P2Q00_33955 [Streptomyces coacervatus]|nr:hypothetical protein [Streptomyces coacervatus]MDF2270397.1 hypothetical protein [Streptomyces coacervatus]